MQKLGRKLAFQWCATFVVGLAAFGLQTVLARELGPRMFGLYSVALSFGGIMYVIQSAGFRALYLREEVKATARFMQSRAILALALSHTFLVTGVLIGTVLLAGFFLNFELVVLAAFILAINAPRIVANLIAVGLIAQNDFEAEAKWQLLSRLIPYGAAIVAALAGWSLIVVLTILVMATLLVLLVRPNQALSLRPGWFPDTTVYRAAIGLGLLDLVTQFYVRISTLVLYDVGVPLGQIGQYGVFQRLLEASTMVLGPLAFMFHNHVRRDGLYADTTRRFGLIVMFGLAGLNLLFVPILYIYGADLLDFVFGSGYSDLAPLLIWLQLGMMLMAANMMMGQALIALNHEWIYVRFGVVISIVSLCANMILAPRFGIKGAVQSTVIVECVLFALMIYRLNLFPTVNNQKSLDQ